ncbi:hypothetical protein E3N88_23773 [Mikania micrantha]|uniref:Aminotransferase-like plant mobile domain-containing protein n=1 Tax=Mikania micrantha TaxID=192012 RepID=A0A5N6NE97_9ASTR|nr:hypothetical protein E3N88_23773 [Mikania micrantha]
MADVAAKSPNSPMVGATLPTWKHLRIHEKKIIKAMCVQMKKKIIELLPLVWARSAIQPAFGAIAHGRGEICHGVSDISKTNIIGPMFLLQLWAWERFSEFAPDTVNSIDFQKPYGARWRSPLTYVRTASHVLSAYRSQLHSLTEDKCVPSRVMRQFRMFQPVPVNTLIDEQEHRRLHGISRSGGRNVNWLQKHNQYVLSWDGRHNNIVTEELTESCVASPEYMQWYLPRTIIYKIDPRHHHQNQHGFPNDGGTLQMTWDIMSQIYQRSRENFIRDMVSQAMGYGQVQHHMGYYPTHMSQDPVGYQVPLVPQSIRRPER